MGNMQSPFLIVNPKSYLYGNESLKLAKAADQAAKDTGLPIIFTCPYADVRMIRGNTGKHHCMRTVYGPAHTRTGNGACSSGIFKGSRSGCSFC